MENEEKLGKLSTPMRRALQKIIRRCEKAGMEYGWEMGFEEENVFFVYIQQGTGKHKIIVYDVGRADKLLDSDFEKYVFVEGYLEAICCYEEGWVEAVVESIGPMGSMGMILSRLTGEGYDEVIKGRKAGKDYRLELVEGGDKGVRISIGDPSKMLLAMLNYLKKEGNLSVRVEGLQITKNIEAVEQLGRVTNSLFFELRKKRNVNLFVSRHYEVETSAWRTESAKARLKRRRESVVGFPKFEYDKQPIELYWHAVSAYKMPLLQYLAYYQILEYYFKKYSVLGAKREISNCLKDPEFNADNDNDIVKIVTCVTGKLGPYVRENELLRDTIRECVSKDELALELNSEALKEYFKKEYKIVSQFKVSQENREMDIRDQLAERIYDIRCRIVHTKEDDKRGRIMPFTKEVVLLRRFDLPMIETVAGQVLIANSKKLSFR
jgi:hypothetical protein